MKNLIQKRNLLGACLLLGGMLIGMAACSSDQALQSQNTNKADPAPTYNNNGSYDDNGAAPMPNAGNQNFGRRW
jgi:hypothetical protein